MKKIFTLFLLYISVTAYSQFIVRSGKMPENAVAHPSAILEILDDNKGILLPKINLATNPITNPKQGLLVYDEDKGKLSFANNNTWVKNFDNEDATGLVKHTLTYVASSSTPKVITGSFSNITAALDSSITGWTDLGVKLDITPTKTSNSILVNAEGMVQTSETSTHNFTYAIAVFVDDKLKIVRKFSNKENGACSWKKFELTGIFKDLTPGTSHTIKLYGKNIESSASNSSNVTLSYGGPNPNLSANHTCRTNLSNFMGRINLSVQKTE